MTREEMLNKLSKIPVSVKVTALIQEGALECVYATPRGATSEWIGMYDWPVSVRKNESGKLEYLLESDGKTIVYDDYGSFEEAFMEHISPLTPWEDCEDDELEEWLEFVEEYNDIALGEMEE